MKRLLALALVLTARPPDRLRAQASPLGTAQQLPLPSPFAGLGFEPGADSLLADWGQITTYLTSVAVASPVVRLDTLGRTTLGRPFLLLTITSPANQRRLEELKRGQRLLADPRGLTPATLETLRATQPAVVLIDNNIHSTEIASSLMGLTLAYQLATDPALTRLLDSVVVLMVPSMNPDGLDTVVAWYRKYKGTPYEGGPLPWLYHPYVGHDNNRDWFMLTQAETRLVTRVLYHDWFPEVAYDVHQMGSNGPRLFLPPFADPVNPNLDPMLVEATNLVGTTMASALYDSGYTGVAHQVSFDLWWHGGFRSVPARHNMIGILSEAASVRLASPMTLPAEALRQPARGVNYPGPWRGGTWRIGDIARLWPPGRSCGLPLMSARRSSTGSSRWASARSRRVGKAILSPICCPRARATPRPAPGSLPCCCKPVSRCSAPSRRSPRTDGRIPPVLSWCRWHSRSARMRRTCSSRSAIR